MYIYIFGRVGRRNHFRDQDDFALIVSKKFSFIVQRVAAYSQMAGCSAWSVDSEPLRTPKIRG